MKYVPLTQPGSSLPPTEKAKSTTTTASCRRRRSQGQRLHRAIRRSSRRQLRASGTQRILLRPCRARRGWCDGRHHLAHAIEARAQLLQLLPSHGFRSFHVGQLKEDRLGTDAVVRWRELATTGTAMGSVIVWARLEVRLEKTCVGPLLLVRVRPRPRRSSRRPPL